MKKLMIMMAAIATGAMAWATGEPAPLKAKVTYTVPTDAEVGPTNIVGYSNNFQTPYTTTGANVHWWMDDFEIGETEDPLTVAEGEVTVDDTTVYKVLQLESSAESPVLRTFTPVGTEGDYDAVTIDDHGTFVDTWVKLSASEGELEAQTGDKIAVWLQVVEEETDDQGLVTVPAATNLVVTCGALNSLFEPTKTNVVLDANIVPDTWHRITIRAMKGIAASSSYKNIGFLVYIDGVIAAAKEGAYLDFTGVELSTEASGYATARKLFPSLQQDEAATLTAAGFSGVGQIASVNLDTQHSAPYFAKDKTFIRITWDEHVQSIVLGDGANMVTTSGVAGTNVIEIVDFSLEGYTSPEQTLKIVYAPTFKCDSITGSNLATFNNDPDGDGKGKTATFSLYEYANGQIDITSQLDRQGASAYIFDNTAGKFVPLFNGATQPYLFNMVGKIAEAIEAGDIDPDAMVKIVLLENEVATTTGNWRNLSCNIVLDLNGHSLTAGDDWTGGYEGDPEDPTIIMYCNNAVICGFSTVSIVDESITGGGAIIGNTTLRVGAIYNRGTMVIGAADGSTPITFNGVVFNDASKEGVMTIRGGMFSAQANGENITLNDGVNNLTWHAPATEGGYWTLIPAGADVVHYSVTVDQTANALVTIEDVEAAKSGNIKVGSELVVVATAADGYEYDGAEEYGGDWKWNSADKSWTFTTIAKKDTPISVTVLPAPAITYVAQVGNTKYRTLAEAINAAAADQTVTLLTNITLTETLTIAKQTAINLDSCTVTFGNGLKNGIVTTADAENLVISNGCFAVAGTRPNGGLAFQLYRVDATIKDVAMDLTGFEYGLEAETMLDPMVNNWTEPLRYTITCENVDVTGNGSLFHFENVEATLDEDCSATLKAGSTPFGAAHNAAIYSSCGAKVTVAGGNYNYSQQVALQTGDLGGTLIVNGGTFTGDIKSFMGNREQRSVTEWDKNIGTITITGGTFDGNFVEEVPGSEKTVWDIKGGTFSADPTKYLAANYATIKNANDKWDVGLAIIATFKVDDAIYTAQTNIVAFTPATPTGPEKPNYTFKGWNPEIDVIAENTTYAAQFSANPAHLTLPTLPDGVAGATVCQSVDGETGWEPVTGVLGAYPIAAGSFYKVAVTKATGYDLVDDGEIISEAAVTAGEEIEIKAEQLEALVQLHSFTITYKQVNEQPITGLNPATFTIADAVTLPNDLGAQLGGTFKGWYANAELTGDHIFGWAAGAKTEDVTVYAKIEQVVDEPAEIVKDKVDVPDDATDAQKTAIHDNAQLIYTKFGTVEQAEAWIASVYGEDAKIPGAKLAAASAENVKIAMEYCIEIMETPVIEFNATVAATEGNVAAFTFQIKDGTEGAAISLAKAKVLSMVQYCSTLGSWAAATSENVAVSVDGATAKAELIQKTSITAGFMKIQLTAPAEEAK